MTPAELKAESMAVSLLLDIDRLEDLNPSELGKQLAWLAEASDRLNALVIKLSERSAA